ncbi:MAG: hypothetical protein R2865_04770 [Deinococcales bacterium]
MGLVSAYSGLFSRRNWQDSDRQAGLIFNIVFGLQFIVGLILYGVSPISRALMADPAYGMSDKLTRFFGVEHAFTMIVAFAIAQIAYSRSKRLSSHRAKFMWAAIGYTLAIVLVLAAIPWDRPFIRNPFLGL